MPSLAIVGGVPARPPLRLEATDRRYVAGRGETCDLQLVSEEISREHAEIVRLWDGVVVNDLGSKNGVRINEVAVSGRRRLRDGDLLQIGPATLRLSDPADRYLRDFEARAPQVPRTENEAVPAPAAAAAAAPAAATPAPAAAAAAPAQPSEVEISAPPRPLATSTPQTPAMTQRSTDSTRGQRAGSSRTAIVVAAIVLIAIGAAIVALAFGG